MKMSLRPSSRLTQRLRLCALALLPALTACEQLGFDSPEKIAAYKEAEGKAIGAGCRQTGRAIEDCYSMNGKSSKAAIFAGWREMDEYMRENKIDIVAATGGDAPTSESAASAPSADQSASAPEGAASKKEKATESKKPKAPSAKVKLEPIRPELSSS